MSCYFSKAKRPQGKEFELVFMLDDFYGQHQYGVKFMDDKIYPAGDCKYMKQIEFTLEEEETMKTYWDKDDIFEGEPIKKSFLSRLWLKLTNK